VGCWDREERVDRETAAAALQYPRRYSTAGTVHRLGVGGQRLGLGARERPAAGLRPRPAREKGFPSNLLLDSKLIHLLSLYREV
jgi:hypothetical protein